MNFPITNPSPDSSMTQITKIPRNSKYLAAVFANHGAWHVTWHRGMAQREGVAVPMSQAERDFRDTDYAKAYQENDVITLRFTGENWYQLKPAPTAELLPKKVPDNVKSLIREYRACAKRSAKLAQAHGAADVLNWSRAKQSTMSAKWTQCAEARERIAGCLTALGYNPNDYD